MANHYVNTDQKSNDLHNLKVAKATFDIGTTGELASGDIVYSGVRIPDGALVIRSWYFVHTVMQGSGTNTAHMKLGFVSDDDEIVEAAVLTTNGTAGPHGGITGCFALDGGALTNDAYALAQGATYVHITGDDEIIMTTGISQTVTGGKLSVFVEYVVTGDLS